MGGVAASIYPFILAEVPVKHAGSASGVINAVGQVGGAMGVAVIGVIFFGLIGSRADVSVDSVKPALTADLVAAGVPSFATPSVIASFATCFHDRANAKDFSVAPDSCKQAEASQATFAASQPELAAKVGAVIDTQARAANQRNFTSSLTRTLLWEIGALFFIFFLTFLLPPKPRTEEELARIAAETGTPIAAM
jgi:hypothetical protein